MSANVSALASEAKRKAIVARTLAWWDRCRRTLAVARGTWGNARSLSGLALRSAAAADDGAGGDALLSGLHCEMAAGRGPGRGPDRRRDERVCRVSAIIPARETCTPAPRKSLDGAGHFRAKKPNCARFPALAPIPQPRSRRSHLAARPRRSMAISPAFWRGFWLWKSRSLAREANLPRRRAAWRRAAGRAISLRRSWILAQPSAARAIPLATPVRSPTIARRSAPEPRRPIPGALEPKARPRRQGAVFFARRSDGAFLARRRPPHGLLASTIELPGTPWTSEGPDDCFAGVAPVVAPWRRLPGEVEQVFTHFALRLTVYAAEFEGGAPAGCFWVAPDTVGGAGFSSMMRKAVEHALTQA